MKLNSVNAPCQSRPQNFGAVKVNAKALEWVTLKGEDHVPGSLRFMLSKMEEFGAISKVTHNAYKSLLGENDVILNKSEIKALKIATKESDADTTIHRLAGARFFDLSALFPKGQQSVIDTCKNKLNQGIIERQDIPKAIKALRRKIFQEADVAPIARIEDSFEGRERTLQGIPQLVVNG